jgi:hypothetical protein
MQRTRELIPSGELAAVVLTVLAWPGIGGEDRAASVDKQVAELIAKLGDNRFAVRQEAEKALVGLGKPALKALLVAVQNREDLEVRQRARRAIQQIDPGIFHRAELEKRRAQLRKEIAPTRGVEASRGGEDVANPFTNLTAQGREKLAARGIDVGQLRKLKAVLLTGSYCGADSVTFVNRDPDTILIIGKGFVTHGSMYSLGPILAVEDAHFMGDVTGADLVWFVDKSFPRGTTTGLPVILAPSARRSQMHPGSADVWFGDYGWRRPDDFLKPAGKKD